MSNIRRRNVKSGLLGLAAFAVAASPVLASAVADTENTTINATVGSTISVTTSSPVAVSLTPTAGGVVSSQSDAVSVSTNNTAGYDLTLLNADTVSTLVSGGNNITAHAGTHATPTALATGTWGYAVAGLGSFDATYSAETNNGSSTTKWAGVPISSGSASNLRSTSATATNEVTTVWYGVKVDTSKPNGVYTDTVTYTATTK